MLIIQAIAVTVFILVHLFAGKLRFLDVIPRSRWLSLAGGISVAYIFIHIFPELVEAQTNIGGEWDYVLFAEHHAYLIALLGLTVFYGLERAVKSAKQRHDEKPGKEEGETPAGMGVFWLHIASFSVYNGLIGYLLVHREEQDERGLLFFSFAMALHFLVNDYGLRHDHQATYKRLGRWVLSFFILAGWITGLATHVEELAVNMLFAFLAGGVILNVLKEELPEERKSRFLPFAAGVAVYAILLLLL